MNSKNVFASKTFWFNAISTAVTVASGQTGLNIPPKIAVPVVAIGNIVLRLLTKQPVTFSF